VLVSGEAGSASRACRSSCCRTCKGSRTRLRYFCSVHRQHSPLHPCIQQIEHAAGFTRDDPPERKLAKLEVSLGDVPERDLQLIAELLLLPTGSRFPILQFAPHKKRERLMHALLGLLERLSRKLPLLVIFEDAQWSDESSRELLALVAPASPHCGSCWSTARPEFEARWTGLPHVTRVALAQLAPSRAPRSSAGSPVASRCPHGWSATSSRAPTACRVSRGIDASGAESDEAGDSRLMVGERATVPWSLQACCSRGSTGSVERAKLRRSPLRSAAFTGELLTLVADRSAPEVEQALERLGRVGP
jgi:hypothetical protein